jgi:hypothetical protein
MTRTILGLVAIAAAAAPRPVLHPRALPRHARTRRDRLGGRHRDDELLHRPPLRQHGPQRPEGKDPSGEIDFCGFTERTILCLAVQGNVAIALSSSTFGGPTAPSRVMLRLTDNGRSGDRVEGTPTDIDTCTPLPSTTFEDIGFSGDLHVTDAHPAAR